MSITGTILYMLPLPFGHLLAPADLKRRHLLWLGLFMALLCHPALAAQPPRTIAQYAHTAWGPNDGAPSAIAAIAQTTDGYLWLGSSDALMRFDGVVFERYKPPSGNPLPGFTVTSLLALPNGDLWIGFSSGDVSRLRDGKATSYTDRDGWSVGHGLIKLVQDQEGTIWAATNAGLERFDGNRWRQAGKEWNFPALPTSLFVDHKGTLWVSTKDTLFFLTKGSRRFEPTGIHVISPSDIAQAPNGRLWTAELENSVHPIPLSDKRLPADGTEVRVGSDAILFDNDGALWITSVGDGLRRATAPELLKGSIKEFSTSVESFTAADGLSDDVVHSIFEDREGNIWVGTNNGLDRFRKTSLVPVPLPSKLNYAFAFLAPGDSGNVWLKSLGKLVRLHQGRAEDHPPLPYSETLYAYRDSSCAVWWVQSHRILRYYAGRYSRIPLPSSSPSLDGGVAATEDGSGTFWLAVQNKGLFYWKEGRWQQLKTPAGLETLRPTAAYTDWKGRAWFGYIDGTIVVIDQGNIQAVFSKDDVAAGSVTSISGRGRHIWIGGFYGLSLFDGNRLRPVVPANAKRLNPIVGVEETSDGSLWLAQGFGVMQIPAKEVQQFLSDPSYRLKNSKSFLSFEGLPGKFTGLYTLQREAQGTDGTLWFSTSRGVVWIDPANVFTNTLPPPVSIRSVNANDKPTASLPDLALPPLTTSLQIGYTATSLSVPEKVHFRYKLQEVDKDWQDAGTRREAFYTRLGPGKYHFQVIACNNDGVWNETGARLDFRIAPAWFQTTWFEVLCVGLFLLFLWALYQLRLRQLERQFNATLQARVDERTRIARELHDTMLQSFQGLLLRFQAVSNLLPARAEEAKTRIDSVIEEGSNAITEGRDAVHELRSAGLTTVELARSIEDFARELLANSSEGGPQLHVQLKGTARNLNPVVRDETYRIAAEALRNAIRHAAAQRIEIEILYDPGHLKVGIRDDGKGIGESVLEQEHVPGHWGLRGMRERTLVMGGTFEIWSKPGSGTALELTIPAASAYADPSASRRSFFSRASRR